MRKVIKKGYLWALKNANNMIRHRLLIVFFCSLTAALTQAQEPTVLTAAELTPLYGTRSRDHVSVHDPSVVHTSGDTFYLMGTMRGYARSTDHMQNWVGLDNGSLFGTVNASGKVVTTAYTNAFSTNQTKKVKALVNGTVQEVDFGNFDAQAWAHADQASWDLGGNMWAPDILYNPNSGKWMMYQSINGDNWHSCIVLLTADDISGPYVYQGPVHYSGFINGTNEAISWKKTDLEIVIGEQTSLPARYNKDNDWGWWWTNDIDPCTFFDEEGQLWMIYGSWSGGIFIIKLDKQTGLRDYTVTYATENDGAGRALSDPYFGKRIAGGYFSSGEGAYIQHIGDYYYLFISYGGYAPGGYEMNEDGSYRLDSRGNKIPQGGYEMRIFRSTAPDGPYLDASGRDACYDGRYWLNYGPSAQTDGGMKLLGAYNKWGFMTTGECAQGHNSATVDDEGRAFVVYHTKFNDGMPQYAFHAVRVHQLFVNADGWLCAAPFEYDGETDTDATLATACRYTADEIAGTYDVLIHKYRMNYAEFEEVTPVQLTLGTDGRVTGKLTGTWTLADGTAYITLKVNNVEYKGVVVQQHVDDSKALAIGITATAASGVSLWAWRMEPQSAIAYTYKTYTMPVRNNQTVSRHLPLVAEGAYGATITWETSHPEVISAAGQYNPADEATKVQLTCHIACGAYTYDQIVNVTAAKAATPAGDPLTGIAAYYDFEGSRARNLYNTNQVATLTRQGSAVAAAVFADEPNRYGQVVVTAASDAKKNSYVRMANPLAGQLLTDGFSIAAWIWREDAADLTGTLWGLTDKAAYQTIVAQRLFLTANGSLHFEDGENSFDINLLNDAASNATGYIPARQWAFVVVTVSPTDGVTLYVDGTRKAHKTFTSTAGTASTATAAAKLFDYSHVTAMAAAASYFQLAHGDAAYGSAAARFDDLFIYSRALTANDVKGLTTLATRTTDFSPEAVGIGSVEMSHSSEGRFDTSGKDQGVYDLSGRRVNRPATPRQLPRGLYIINGRKVVVR